MNEHGLAGYRHGCKCLECRADYAAYMRVLRARNEARLRVDPKLVEHGRESTYKNWNCRCDACREAHRVYHLVGGYDQRYQDRLSAIGLQRQSSFTNPVPRKRTP